MLPDRTRSVAEKFVESRSEIEKQWVRSTVILTATITALISLLFKGLDCVVQHGFESNCPEIADSDSYLECLRRANVTDVRSVELFRFLYLRGRHANVSPSPVAEEYWHRLLLLPLMCKKVCTAPPTKTVFHSTRPVRG
jgi:hypothetical protein